MVLIQVHLLDIMMGIENSCWRCFRILMEVRFLLNNTMALVDVSHAKLESLGVTDGKMHDLRWEIRIGDGFSYPRRVRLWIDDIFVAESNTTGINSRLEAGNWASTRVEDLDGKAISVAMENLIVSGRMKLALPALSLQRGLYG